MRYKTIFLELLKQQTALYEHLRITRQLMPTLERCSLELKATHEVWMETLTAAKADIDLSQIERQALEMAILEMEASLLHASQMDEPEVLSLERAINYIQKHSSH